MYEILLLKSNIQHLETDEKIKIQTFFSFFFPLPDQSEKTISCCNFDVVVFIHKEHIRSSFLRQRKTQNSRIFFNTVPLTVSLEHQNSHLLFHLVSKRYADAIYSPLLYLPIRTFCCFPS